MTTIGKSQKKKNWGQREKIVKEKWQFVSYFFQQVIKQNVLAKGW